MSGCICQICTCGRHRCPHNRGTLGTGHVREKCLVTEYKTEYGKYEFQPPRASLRPALRSHTSSVPMQNSTMYREAFKQHVGVPRESLKPKNKHVPPNKAMDLTSTYKQDYTGKKGKRPESYQPEQKYVPRDARLSGNTEYKVTYQPYGRDQWAWCRPPPVKRKENIEIESSEFDAISTMKDDFHKHEKPERVAPIIPKSNNRKAGKFDPSTTYKTNYTKKEMTPTVAKPPKAQKLPDAPFVGESTVKADFKPIEGHHRPACFKPVNEYQPSKLPFSQATTVSDAYKPWEVQRRDIPSWSKQKQYVVPTVPFTKASSYQDEFIRPATTERACLAKPRKNEICLKQGGNSIPHRTHYQEMYLNYKDAQPPNSFKIIQNYEAPKEPFESESMYQSNYRGDGTAPAEICYPKVKSSNSPRKAMEDSTTYKDTYKGNRPKSCPAAELRSVPSVGGKVGKMEMVAVKNGHFFYKDSTAPMPAQNDSTLKQEATTKPATANVTKNTAAMPKKVTIAPGATEQGSNTHREAMNNPVEKNVAASKPAAEPVREKVLEMA